MTFDIVCGFCGGSSFENREVEYEYRRGERGIPVARVPAEVCTGCGMAFFEPEPLRKIEARFDHP